MLMEMDPEMREAGENLKELSADEKARYLAESRVRSQFAYELEIAAREEKGRNEGRNEGLVEGRNEGLVEGRNEGLIEGRNEGLVEGRNEGLVEERNEEKIEIAKNLLALDLTLETISAATNLSIPELEQIKNNK